MSVELIISTAVQDALNRHAPVVALESTIISHGMPYPQNVQTAKEVERIIAETGAIPATIAILNGRIHVGLENDSLELLGNSKEVMKVSIRDLPYVVSKKLHGATTVAATMRIASMAGIKVFVTGGIGGVHRGAETSMDISADLTEMAKTNVAIVSAGIKSILDIGLTLEYLETLGIPVVTFASDDFPSFYSRSSKFKTPLRLDHSSEIASMLFSKWQMNLEGSVLIANPIDAANEVPFDKIESYIQDALNEAAKASIKGKDLTPFILKHIATKTGGESLATNIALIKSNAKLGAQIAVELAKIS